LAEDYDDPATVWAVYQDIHGDEWAVETVSTSLEELRVPEMMAIGDGVRP
jgi:hypothetical protein